MKITLRNIDRRAALLAGHEVGPVATIDAAPADFGDAWPDVVAALDLSNDGSAVCQARNIAAPTIEAIVAAVAADKAYFEAGWNEITAEIEAAIAHAHAAEPIEYQRLIRDPDTFAALGELTNWKPPHIPRPGMYDRRVTADRRADPIWARLEAAFSAMTNAIEARNNAAIEAALPRLREEKVEADKISAEAAAIEAAEKKAALVALGAGRLESGYWERETAAYNSRRDGKPWCATVTLDAAAGKLTYNWGEWIGRVGEAGIMRLPCKPGDIIAWGQKDMKRHDKSIHVIQQMGDDGLMRNLTTVDAVKILRG
jgi:hypothetical protein